MSRILTINCGSTSTKVAWFDDDREIARASLDVPLADLASMPKVLDQTEYRTGQVREFLRVNELDATGVDMVVARAGTIHHVRHDGAYAVNELMIATLRYAPAAQHASALSALIGVELVAGTDIPVIIYDPTCVDSVDEIAKITGVPQIVNMPVYHLLNPKAAGRTYAASIGAEYNQLNLVIAHLGGGITMAFHDHGRVVDWIYDDGGPMSPQRGGAIPTRLLTDFIYTCDMDHAQMRMYLAGKTGIAAHLGTQDVREVELRIAAGDAHAELIYRAMAYGVAKGVGQLATVRAGNVDQIILTGGIAHSALFTGWVRDLVEWIAPVTIQPGENEMEALAAGGLRVLRGEEPVHDYDVLPAGYSSLADIIARPSFLA
ncbi:MAG: butyrate kinase [Propionicimonas sp.]|uniref:butyrate kinase n=1 Tax=Propionicimonas sp. TaxID=1955623 RepID=UPI002B1F988D|nr:butyrate kinase [Propionicimonas sp.]MEA4944018.1 butyrate kinase [Propionicimonas sp.]